MPVINMTDAAIFRIPGITFTGLASPSRGSRENSVWLVNIEPNTLGHPHQLTREEVFVVTGGQAIATLDGVNHELQKGMTLVVPANTPFSLANPFTEAFEAIVVFPAGGQAVIHDQEPFTPPWAI